MYSCFGMCFELLCNVDAETNVKKNVVQPEAGVIDNATFDGHNILPRLIQATEPLSNRCPSTDNFDLDIFVKGIGWLGVDLITMSECQIAIAGLRQRSFRGEWCTSSFH